MYMQEIFSNNLLNITKYYVKKKRLNDMIITNNNL